MFRFILHEDLQGFLGVKFLQDTEGPVVFRLVQADHVGVRNADRRDISHEGGSVTVLSDLNSVKDRRKQDILGADDVAGKDAAFLGMEFDGVFEDKVAEVRDRERESGDPAVLAGYSQAAVLGDGFSQDIIAVFIRVNMKKLTGQAVDHSILFLQQFDRVIQLYIHDVLLGFLRIDHGYVKSGITDVRPGLRRGDRVHDPGEPEDLRGLRFPARYQALQEFKPVL